MQDLDVGTQGETLIHRIRDNFCDQVQGRTDVEVILLTPAGLSNFPLC